jgi:hypothetical protein
MKAVVASLSVALVLVSGAFAHEASTSKTGASLVPRCPHARYGADGTMGPVFCVVVNPVALLYYEKHAPHLFALGSNATPFQVSRAVRLDKTTLPIECEAFRIQAWRYRWSFGVVPVEYCDAPTFSVDS